MFTIICSLFSYKNNILFPPFCTYFSLTISWQLFPWIHRKAFNSFSQLSSILLHILSFIWPVPYNGHLGYFWSFAIINCSGWFYACTILHVHNNTFGVNPQKWYCWVCNTSVSHYDGYYQSFFHGAVTVHIPLATSRVACLGSSLQELLEALDVYIFRPRDSTFRSYSKGVVNQVFKDLATRMNISVS